jgi:hypothetical protein
LKIKNAQNKIFIIIGLLVIMIFTLINNAKTANAWTFEEICDDAIQNLYNKPFPIYENIDVFYNGHVTKLITLPPDDKFNLLVETALGYHNKQRIRNDRVSYDTNPDDYIKRYIRYNDASTFSTIHGPKHCARTAILSEEIARLYKKLYIEFERITKKEIKCCFLAGVYHDSGRQTDGPDIYDPLSAHYCEIDLNSKGFAPLIVQNVKTAILNKDETVATKDKIAIALHDADSMEMQRFGSRFDSRYLNCNCLTLRAGVDSAFAQAQVDALCQRSKNFIINTGFHDNDFNRIITYQEAVTIWRSISPRRNRRPHNSRPATPDQPSQIRTQPPAPRRVPAAIPSYTPAITPSQTTVGAPSVFRAYNPNSGLHHYTMNWDEVQCLVGLGWNYEIPAFKCSDEGVPIYRVYNKNDGNHHYTMDANEKNYLITIGWDDEGTAFCALLEGPVPVHRAYNPGNGEHFYTTNYAEIENAVNHGWNYESIAWFTTEV